MNYGANGKELARADGGAEGAKPDRCDKSSKAGPRLGSNWAWENPQGHYDWMDSHAPFASLD
jgi:hypothetical protein